jgi:purine catabolism regulator
VLQLFEVLRLPSVRSAQPEVLAGASGLDRPVRWVHTTELVDIGPLLRGGDLVLTTGVALPDGDEALERFAAGLVESDAAGLFLELGRRWSNAPDALVAACERLGLPLVALHREVKFAALTQAVGERLVDEQLAELRDAQRVHDTFTELGIAEASPGEILDAAQRLAGGAVVLESQQHVVLDFRAGSDDVAPFLEDWERRSRRLDQDVRTVWDDGNGWLVTRVGRRERGWGRLVLESATAPDQRMVAVAERAATALAMHRLHDRTRDHQVRRLHQELLQGLQSDPGDSEISRRVQLTGIPVTGCSYVGLSLRPHAESTSPTARGGLQLDEVVAACLRAAELVRRPVLVAAFESEVRLLLPVPNRFDADRATERFVEHVRERVRVLATQGSAASALNVADRTLREAQQVLASVGGEGRPVGVLRLHDLHLRGLLALLADDDRARAFVERELGALKDPEDDGLVHVARTVVEHWANKSLAAQQLNLSRPALYARIETLQRRLGIDLHDPEARTSLHVALILDDLSPA